jgi:hypothetical protein
MLISNTNQLVGIYFLFHRENLMFPFLFSMQVFAAPALTETAMNNAYTLLRVDDDNDPVGRLLIALAARERNADYETIYALAGTHPHVANMLIQEDLKLALDYIQQLPSSKRNQLRRGSTIIRNARDMQALERVAANSMATYFGLKSKKIDAIRVGKLNEVEVLLEISVEDRREGKIVKQIHLGRPYLLSTNEKLREELTRHFGGRPAQPSKGPYSLLSIQSPSFESTTSLEQEWGVTIGEMMGAEYPVGNADLEYGKCLDSLQCLRFYNTDKTRSFPMVSQWVSLDTSNPYLRATAYFKAEDLRVEFQQTATGARMEMGFYDDNGDLIGSPIRKNARLGTYDWEPLIIHTEIPTGSSAVKISFMSAQSGKLWIDSLQMVYLPY